MARITSHCFLLTAVILAFASTASPQAKEAVIYSFQGVPDGATPVGGTVFDKDGNLYGATLNGGQPYCFSPDQCGTVYQLSPPAKLGQPWKETILYVFKGREFNDGTTPEGGLVMDKAGNLYGTTGYGGTGPCVLLGTLMGCGTVYELVRPVQPGGTWTEKILYSFQGGNDVYIPFGDLTIDAHGNLFGATFYGGGKGSSCNFLYPYCGTIFELTSTRTTAKGASWTERVLHSFEGVDPINDVEDGSNPNGGLVLDKTGAIYGTTFSGGNQLCDFGHGILGCGIAFQLVPPGEKDGEWVENVLHRFTLGADGGQPNGSLILDSKGRLYGTAQGGSISGGIVFRLTSLDNAQWEESVLYELPHGQQDGAEPLAGIVLDREGNLNGTAAVGGTSDAGTVFRLKGSESVAAGSRFTVLHSFGGVPDGIYPEATVTLDKFGNLFGTTQLGGTGTACNVGCGTVFQLTP